MSDALPRIRQALTELFAAGLSAVRPETLAKLREVLEGGGLQRSVALLEDLGIQKDGPGRFKSFTKLLLALRQLELALTPFARLKAGGFVPVAALRGFAIGHVPPPPDAAGGSTAPADVRRPRLAGLLRASEKVDYGRAALPELIEVLTHSFHRAAALEKLLAQPEDRRETLGVQLLKHGNRLLRRSGVALLGSLGARLTAMKALLPLLGDPAVGAHFRSLGSRGVTSLGSAVDSGDAVIREAAVRLLKAIADERAEPFLKRFLNDSVPAVRAHARLGLAAIGAVEPKFLQAAALEKDDAILRIYAKLELVKGGHMPAEKLMDEVGDGRWKQYKIAVPALAELPDVETLLAPQIGTFLTGHTREQRRAAFELLQHLPEDRHGWLFDRAAEDCDPDIARKGLEVVVRRDGFSALDRHVELCPVLTKEYGDLSPEEKEHALERVFPFVAETGDCRFVPYLTGLLRDRCFAGPSIEFTYSLRPGIAQFGVPMEAALKEMSRDPNPNLSGAAGEILSDLRAKAS